MTVLSQQLQTVTCKQTVCITCLLLWTASLVSLAAFQSAAIHSSSLSGREGGVMQVVAVWAQVGPGCLWGLTSTMAYSFQSANCKQSVNAVTVTVNEAKLIGVSNVVAHLQ